MCSARCARRSGAARCSVAPGAERVTGGISSRPVPPLRRHVHCYELQQQKLQAAAAGQGRLPAGSFRCGDGGLASLRPSARPLSRAASPQRRGVGGPWCRFRRPQPAVTQPSLSLPGECSAFKERFMECLRDSGYESGACRHRAMAYLECRMERYKRGGGAAGRGRKPIHAGGALWPCKKQVPLVASAVCLAWF